METFTTLHPDRSAARYAADFDQAMLCAALAHAGEPQTETRKGIYQQWVLGSFNGAAFSIPGIGQGCGLLDWQPDGDGFGLTWHSPAGVACRLARLFPQADGSWAAMVVAGVKDGLPEAMATAEWAVSRLTA